MRKLIIIFLLIASLLLTGLLSGCIKQISPETTVTKIYTIQVSIVDWQKVNLITGSIKDESKKAFMKDVLIKEYTTASVYYAKEVKDFSDTNVRFIDNNTGKEQFISADHITITQTK